MLRGLNAITTGMQLNEVVVQVISNNLANQNTPAFNASIVYSEDLAYQNETRVGTNPSGSIVVPTGVQVGLGTKLSAIVRRIGGNDSEGTEREYDVAIKGKGYFMITLPDGTTAYTRAGNFTLNNTGQIVTQDGYPISPAITIPPTAIATTISDTGSVSVKLPATVDPSQVGTIELAIFNNETGLLPLGNNLFAESEASGAPVVGTPFTENFGALEQMRLEKSNVSPITEITNLITAHRSYELGSKVITAVDEMVQTLVNMA